MFRIGNAGRAAGLLIVIIGLLVSSPAAAQVLTLARQHEGTIDYVAVGNTHRTGSNSGDACAVANSSTANVAIPTGSTLVAAYLYWAGSGTTTDASVTLARPSGGAVTVNAEVTSVSTYPYNGNNLRYFGGFVDVTAQWRGNGTYGVSNFTVSTGNPYCDVEGVAKGWAMFVVYSNPAFPVRRIQLRHGLRAFRQATESVNLTNFMAADEPEARVTFLLYEGDAEIAGDAQYPEQLLFNGSPFSDGLNPAANPYNSTINTTVPGRSNVYGVDLDTYNASSYFTPRARTAAVALSAGGDMVVLQTILTSLSVSLVNVTPDGLTVEESRLPGRYSRQFTVENVSLTGDNADLLSSVTAPAGLMVLDSITGPGVTRGTRGDSARVFLASGATLNVLVWYTVPVGTGAPGLINLQARSATYPTLAPAQDTGYTQMRRVAPRLTITKGVTPANTLSPGTDLTYAMQVRNVGEFAARGVVVTDSVPPQVAFKLASVTQALPAGVTAVAAYSSDGVTFGYTPVAGGCGAPVGYDACVRRLRWTLTGDLAAGTSPPAANFTFVARIR
ncbi:DUF11 domain-containing protein [Longimicrobium terrae]|uniref:DUF11 domain-containing protein n=1 Tax=Longimicrobium terrae TaxID=1639882 RepID=UPI001474B205|nr:hypothetical protein [Longimicrobium terrae]